ncbi:hypothetical protein [Megasphaera sp.]|uniref:gp53-like domain-containing protein n=1 Tax=Megasphaera sp. TaxID=2023260 RepID=UPI003522647A
MMEQDCFLTFGICRKMIMMQRGKQFILPLENRQWGLLKMNKLGTIGTYDYCRFPIAFSNTKYSIVANHRGTNAAIVYQWNEEIKADYCVLCAKDYNGNKNTPWDINWIAMGY